MFGSKKQPAINVYSYIKSYRITHPDKNPGLAFDDEVFVRFIIRAQNPVSDEALRQIYSKASMVFWREANYEGHHPLGVTPTFYPQSIAEEIVPILTSSNAALASVDIVHVQKALPEPQKEEEVLLIPKYQRARHVYIAGATQHGKSTFMEHMIAQDMQGEGLTVIDPKGDLAEACLLRVPDSRKDDCIYIDIKNPIPIDFMSWNTEQERQTLLADVYQTFLHFSTMTTGDQWLSILRWTIHTLLISKIASFLDIYYFLAHEDRRREILKAVQAQEGNEDILHYWNDEFTHLKSPREGPILTRMAVFTTTPPLKIMLGTPNAGFDILSAMDDRKIIIANLMGVGRENGNLVGALLTSRIQQAAFRRQAQPKDYRVPHFFYADEFQNFQTSSFDTILSEASGFKLYLTLANQGLYQLESSIKQSIFANVTGARIAFRLSHEDLSNWKYMLPSDPDSYDYIDPMRLANLPPYTAMFKIGKDRAEIRKAPAPLPPVRDMKIADYIKKNTHAQYGLKRTVDSGACASPQVPHDVNNDDEPQPGAAPTRN